MKARTHTGAIVIALALSFAVPAFAQSPADKNKAQAYYFAAEEAYENGQYEDAINALAQAEDLAGNSGYYIMLRAKTYFLMGNYRKAKTEMDKFYASSPPEAMQREMAPMLLEIDKKLEAQRLAEAKAAAAKAEALRIEALKAPERDARARISSAVNGNFLTGTLRLSGKNGKDGVTERAQGKNGASGTDGTSGAEGMSLTIFVEQIPFEQYEDYALLTFVDGNGDKRSGYMNLSKTFALDISGGRGGNGGHATNGRNGANGKPTRGNASVVKIFSTPGEHGGNGGNGGHAGAGGDGGSAVVYLLGDADFQSQMKRQFSINASGGAAGMRGNGGYGGKGGQGGWTKDLFVYVQDDNGVGGMGGKHGKTAEQGNNGSVQWRTVDAQVFRRDGITLHRDSGPIMDQSSLASFVNQNN